MYILSLYLSFFISLYLANLSCSFFLSISLFIYLTSSLFLHLLNIFSFFILSIFLTLFPTPFLFLINRRVIFIFTNLLLKKTPAKPLLCKQLMDLPPLSQEQSSGMSARAVTSPPWTEASRRASSIQTSKTPTETHRLS